MMATSMPSASSLNDLLALLQLLEAAKDPVESKKAIELLRAERKAYDDAIAQAGDAQRAAANVSRAAAEMMEQAQADRADAAEYVKAAQAQRAEAQLTAEQAQADLQRRREEVAQGLATIASREASLRAATAAAAKAEAQAGQMLLDAKASAAEIRESADVVMAEALAAKAMYEDKLAKLKALSE